MQKPKLLIALFRLPYPMTDGTRYKILNNLVEGAIKDFDVEFFIVNIKKYEPDDVAYLEKNFGKVHLFQHSKIAYGINAMPAFFSGLPLQARAFLFPDAKRWLDEHIDEYAAVYIHEIRMTEFFIRYSDERKRKMLVDFNDAISMNYAVGWRKMSFPRNLFFKWEGDRVARYESNVLKSFFHFNIVSNVDRTYLMNQAMLSNNTVLDFGVIPHGALMSEAVAELDHNTIFFMGSLDYPPNKDALVYFLTTIWPGLVKKIPDIKLLVLGGGHIDETYRRVNNVLFLGFVDVVFDAVRHSKALVAPIRYAGGTPSKILEAMGYGIPVVTTPSGIAGIAGAEPSVNCVSLSESDVDAWIEILEKIMNDESFRTMIAKNAHALVLGQYSSAASQNKFRELFRKITGNDSSL